METRARARPCPTLCCPVPLNDGNPIGVSIPIHTHTNVTNGCHIRSRYYDQIRSGNKKEKDVAKHANGHPRN